MLSHRPGMTSSYVNSCDLRIHPHFGPRAAGHVAAEFDAVVQAEGAVMPELDPRRRDPPSAPTGRARHFADHVLGRDQSDRLFEGKAAFERLRLLRGPGADLRLFRPC